MALETEVRVTTGAADAILEQRRKGAQGLRRLQEASIDLHNQAAVRWNSTEYGTAENTFAYEVMEYARQVMTAAAEGATP